MMDAQTTPIGVAHSRIAQYLAGLVPAMQSAGLEALDVECLRRHYARTLGFWSKNYEQQSQAIQGLVNETTYRVWRIYLAGSAHAFSQNWVSVYQVLACKAGSSEQLNPTPWSRAYMYA